MTTRATHLLLGSASLRRAVVKRGHCFGWPIWKVRRTEESATYRKLRLYFPKLLPKQRFEERS